MISDSGKKFLLILFLILFVSFVTFETVFVWIKKHDKTAEKIVDQKVKQEIDRVKFMCDSGPDFERKEKLESDRLHYLSEKADVMVEGVVTKTKTILLKNSENIDFVTLVTVDVYKDFKGKLNTGDKITFVQQGGRMKVKDVFSQEEMQERKITNDHKDNEVERTFKKIRVSNEGDKVIFFAKKYNEDIYNIGIKEFYAIVGEIEGRFDLNDISKKFVGVEPLTLELESGTDYDFHIELIDDGEQLQKIANYSKDKTEINNDKNNSEIKNKKLNENEKDNF